MQLKYIPEWIAAVVLAVVLIGVVIAQAAAGERIRTPQDGDIYSMTFVCETEEAAREAYDMYRLDPTTPEASELWNRLFQTKKCGAFQRPLPVVIHETIHTSRDWEGDPVFLVAVHPVQKPETRHYGVVWAHALFRAAPNA